MSSRPTEETYSQFQHLYDFFNTALFDGRLPPCLITLQRKNRTYGYFHAERFDGEAGAVTDEIALNPKHFRNRSTEETLSTVVHEMTHLQQHHFGTPSRPGYHNKEWSLLMDAVGLCPSTTGAPGGKRTGQKVSHYIIDGGPFSQACAVLLAEGVTLSWGDRGEEPEKPPGKSGTRTKYTCPACSLNAWSKPEVVLFCGACQVPLDPETA